MHNLRWITDLYRLGHSVGLKETSKDLQQQVLKHVVDGFEARNGLLALLGDDNQMRVVAGLHASSASLGVVVTPGSGLMGQVVEEGQALLTTPAQTGTADSALCWPLKVDERTIGVLCVYRQSDSEPFNEADLDNGQVLLDLISVVIENILLHESQNRRIDTLSGLNHEMNELNHQLATAQTQLLQAEKLASIGQLAAGIAHELNNPIGYVISNLGTLQSYLRDLFEVLAAYEGLENQAVQAQLEAIRRKVDTGFLREDIGALLDETLEGLDRVRRIVRDLKDFSHADQPDWEWANLHQTIDSAHNIALNEIKYRAQVVKEYGTLPLIECMPTQLGQVFVNLLINAAHAMDGSGTITIRTGCEDEEAWVEMTDTGRGIDPAIVGRIFDPFFTTKPVGQGTGLGLALSYNIVRNHHGTIDVESEIGKGTTFRVRLPVRQPDETSLT